MYFSLSSSVAIGDFKPVNAWWECSREVSFWNFLRFLVFEIEEYFKFKIFKGTKFKSL